MKKLKRKNLFYGKSTPIVIILLVDLFIIVLSFVAIADKVENKYKYLYWAVGSALLTFISLYINYKIANRLTPEEKKKIATASPPEWIQVPKTMKEHFTYDPKTFCTLAMVVFIFELVIILITIMEAGLEFTLYMAAVIFSITIIAFIVTAINEKKWASMDESAIYTKIEIDHNFTIKEKTKHGTTKTNYIVFYQPDGKYILPCSPREKIPTEIIVIKYKNLIRWEDACKFKL